MQKENSNMPFSSLILYTKWRRQKNQQTQANNENTFVEIRKFEPNKFFIWESKFLNAFYLP